MAEYDAIRLDDVAMDRFTTGERLKQARKKRAQQLKKYGQYEKHLEKSRGKKSKHKATAKAIMTKVHFPGNVLLLEAASRNDAKEVRELLLSGIDPNVSNEDGLTALHQCCIDNSEDILQLLLEFGARVNSCDSELWTPLHAAATCGHVNLCKYLIEHDADLLAVNGDGNMPYDICEHEATLDCIESEMAKRGITQQLINETRLLPERLLLDDLKTFADSGKSLEFRGRNGETPLHIAATNGYIEVTRFLLNQKVSVNVTDNDLWQPIHCAAFWCQLPVVELLLQHGASLDVRTRNGESPIDICEDAEAKNRILEMQKQIDSCSQSFKSQSLSRQRNSSVRSSSVRRSSMKEKKALSLKDAREEGRWLHESAMTNEDDNEDTVAGSGTGVAATRSSALKKSTKNVVHDISSSKSESNSPINLPPFPNSLEKTHQLQYSTIYAGCPNDGSVTELVPNNDLKNDKAAAAGKLLSSRNSHGSIIMPGDKARTTELCEESHQPRNSTTALDSESNESEKTGLNKMTSPAEHQFDKSMFCGRRGCCKQCCIVA